MTEIGAIPEEAAESPDMPERSDQESESLEGDVATGEDLEEEPTEEAGEEGAAESSDQMG